jgi:hypothetical protein
MLDRSEQKGPKHPFGLIDMPQPVLLDQQREELLRQVFGRVRRVALSSHIRVQRKPIDASQLFQRPLPPTVRVGSDGGQHNAPTRREKVRVRVSLRGSGGGHDEPFFPASSLRRRTIENKQGDE